jgi:deoxyribose-phosphate aldolase
MDSIAQIAAMIDHTLLKPEATRDQIAMLCGEARQNHFGAVCVNPVHVAFCCQQLQGSDVKVATVIGFPLGATDSAVKAFEAKTAIAQGAQEVDMVIQIGLLKSGLLDEVRTDIHGVVEAGHAGRALVKVIIETSLLTDDEKRTACRLAKEAGADFVKTSTGFSTGGATIADVRLMRAEVGHEMGVKASGGVRTYEDAIAMIQAGATRLGTSAGVKIVLGAGAAAHPADKGY